MANNFLAAHFNLIHNFNVRSQMTEEKWPYNLPIWRRSFRLASPDGKVTAEIANAVVPLTATNGVGPT